VIEEAAIHLSLDEDVEEDPEELVFEDSSSDEDVPPPVPGADDFIPLEEADAVIGDLPPLAAADAFLPAPDPELEALDAEDLEEPVRPDYVDVYMPLTNLRLFDNLAYDFVNLPEQNPDPLILEAADLGCGCGPDCVALYPSSRGARVAVFSSTADRESAVDNGPFLGQDVSVYFERHDEADNRFLFANDTLAALSISDFPLEHWHRDLIIHSSAPFANPHAIDPICLTGTDFSEVLITVKAESISDIPLHLTIKNHGSTGAISRVSIIDYEDLVPSSDDPSDGPRSDLDSIPEAFSSDSEQFLELQGGACFGEVLQAIGAPSPLSPTAPLLVPPPL
jgi:hypothetical protein